MTWFNLKYLILLVVFLLPTYLIRFHWGGFSTNLWEILVLAILFLWLYEKKREKRFKSEFNKLIVLRGYFFPLSLIFIGLLAGAVHSGRFEAGVGHTASPLRYFLQATM